MNEITTLDWCFKNNPKNIDKNFYKAGKILQKYWNEAFFSGFISSVDLNHLIKLRGLLKSKDSIVEKKANALNKVISSIGSVGNPELEKILIDVVCNNEKISDFEKKMKWRKGSGGIVLRISLYRLAVFYEIITHESYVADNLLLT